MNSKIGNEYIIKIRDEVLATDRNGNDCAYYFIDGFNALVLDNYAICQLKKLSDHDAAFTKEANRQLEDAYKKGVAEGLSRSAVPSDTAQRDLRRAYRRGMNDAWNTARRLVAMTDEQRQELFDTGYVFEEYSAQEAMDALGEDDLLKTYAKDLL